MQSLVTVSKASWLGEVITIFEELPTCSDGQWSAVSSKLNTLTTEKLCIHRDLYYKGMQAENVSNFQINTNVECIKDSNGRICYIRFKSFKSPITYIIQVFKRYA